MDQYSRKISWKIIELQSQLSSIVDNSQNGELLLLECKQYFQPQHYDEVIEERYCQKLCGYPICNKNIKIYNTVSDQYRIDTKNKQLFHVNKSKYYCSTTCIEKSLLFQSTLDTSNPLTRNIKNAETINSPKKLDEVLAVLDNVTDEMKTMNLSDDEKDIVYDKIDKLEQIDENNGINYPSLPPYSNPTITNKGMINIKHLIDQKDKLSEILDLSDINIETSSSNHLDELKKIIDKSSTVSKKKPMNEANLFNKNVTRVPKQKQNNKLDSAKILSNVKETINPTVKPEIIIPCNGESLYNNEISTNESINQKDNKNLIDLNNVAKKFNISNINHPSLQPVIMPANNRNDLPNQSLDELNEVNNMENHNDISNNSISAESNSNTIKEEPNNKHESNLSKSILDFIKPISNNTSSDIKTTNNIKTTKSVKDPLEIIDLCGPAYQNGITEQDRIDHPEWFNDWDKYDIDTNNNKKYRRNKMKKNVKWNDNIENDNI